MGIRRYQLAYPTELLKESDNHVARSFQKRSAAWHEILCRSMLRVALISGARSRSSRQSLASSPRRNRGRDLLRFHEGDGSQVTTARTNIIGGIAGRVPRGTPLGG